MRPHKESESVLSVKTGLVGAECISPRDAFQGISDLLLKATDREEMVFPGNFEIVRDLSQFFGPQLSIQVLLGLSDSTSYVESLNNDRFNFHTSSDSKTNYANLPHLLYTLGELPRQRELDSVTVHAAALSTPDNNGVLILGDKGRGKTSLSIQLGMQHSYRLVGNNLIVIGKDGSEVDLLAGTKSLVARVAALKDVPALAHLFVDFKGSGHEEKKSFKPEELGIEKQIGKTPISTVIRVHIHPSEPHRAIATPINDLMTERLRLFENFSRYIRGVSTPLILNNNSVEGFIPSLDSPRLSKMRSELIESILSLNFQYVSGNSVMAVAEKVDQIVRRT